MPTYLITNRVTPGFTASPEAFAAWTTWFDGMGSAVADRGNPVFAATTIGNCGPDTTLGGYTLVTAGDLAEATRLAADHPLLSRGGGVEIGELTLINDGSRLRGPGYTATVSVHVPAAPDAVFSLFTDPARYTQWMGSAAVLNPVPGGEYRIQMADGFAAAGSFTFVDPPRGLGFTWGFADDEAAQRTKGDHADSASVMPAGSTQVTVTFEEEGPGTRLTLRHENLPSAELRLGHQVAWDSYLPRLVIRMAGGDPGPDPHA